MSYSIHQRLQTLLQETNDAFGLYGPGDADFAEFASLSITAFKQALDRPNLTRTELKTILRSGMQRHRNPDPLTWTEMLAQHVAQTSNANQTGV